MIQAIVSDLSRVLLFPRNDSYEGGLNALHDSFSLDGEYDFWKYYKLNQELYNFFKEERRKREFYIFTTRYIQEHPSLSEKLGMIAIEVFSCTRMQIKKSEPQSFKDIARIIGINPENILFLDDSHKNILAAQEAGLRVVHFESNAQAIQDMKKLLQT